MLIANYHEPQQQIRGLADPNCAVRAVFLEGGPSYGKSYILECLKPQLAPQTQFVVIELDKRRSAPTPVEILTEIGDCLGWDHCSCLDAAKLQIEQNRPILATVANATIHGSYNNIQSIAQESEDDHLLSAMRVTTAFLRDLRQFPPHLRPVILAFDGYDADMSLIDRWFDRSLVPGLCKIDHVRLIVCGREVPHTTVKARAGPAQAIEIPLKGVPDERDWMPIISALKRRIPGNASNEQSWYLRGLIRAHRGVPGLIMTEIKLFEAES
jgi:hypothetical protein